MGESWCWSRSIEFYPSIHLRILFESWCKRNFELGCTLEATVKENFTHKKFKDMLVPFHVLKIYCCLLPIQWHWNNIIYCKSPHLVFQFLTVWVKSIVQSFLFFSYCRAFLSKHLYILQSAQFISQIFIQTLFGHFILQSVLPDWVLISILCNYFISQVTLHAVYFFHGSKLFIGKSIKHFKPTVILKSMEKY